MNILNPKVDTYLSDGCGRCSFGGTPQCKVHSWSEELEKLRSIILDCGLTEELKWGVPCYTYQNRNIVLMSAFKNYCTISFFKGVLLKNTHDILDKPGENSQSVRQIRFTDSDNITELDSVLKAYINEAVEIEKSRLKVNFKAKKELVLPTELEQSFEDFPSLKTAFKSLTPGRQRGYVLYFSAPKQSKTRKSRIAKNMQKIFDGKGISGR